MDLSVLLPTLVFVSFLTYAGTPFISRKMLRRGITGVDVHKLGRPVRAEMGGVVFLFATAAGSALLAVFSTARCCSPFLR